MKLAGLMPGTISALQFLRILSLLQIVVSKFDILSKSSRYELALLHQELVYGLDGSYQQNKHPMHLVTGQVHHSSCFGYEMGLLWPSNGFLGSIWGALDNSDAHENLLR